MLHSGGESGADGVGHVAIGCGRFADEPGGSVLNVRIQLNNRKYSGANARGKTN